MDIKKNSTESRVRRVGRDLFVEEGFHKVSMRKLAGKLGMQAGSLYNYMDSKQELLFGVIQDFEAQLLVMVRTCTGGEGSDQEKLLRYVDAVIRFIMNNVQASWLARLELRSLSADQRAVIATLREEHLKCLRITLVRCTTAAADFDSDFLMNVVFSLLINIASWNDTHGLECLIKDCQKLIFSALGHTRG